MRVGIRASQMAADSGGGFTFEREVLGDLLRVAGESRHEFVALDGLRAGRPPGVAPSNFTFPPPPGLARRIWRRATRADAEAGVDVVWNLSPSHEPTDVPFITVVWDLQHRLQPFFPEVSSGGEWARRERRIGENLRRAAAVVAGTKAGQQEISTFFQVPERRIHVLPHPTPRFALEASPSAPGLLERFGLPGRYLLYPAQFWPHKNHVNLLHALRVLREGGIELSAALVGSDKGNAPVVRRLAEEMGLSSQVHFLGFVTTEELVALYRGAACLAYVSLFGPENLPPLEAFALGCPVVAADVPGSAEQLGDAALRVDATDPAALAAAVRQVCVDEDLRSQMVVRGRERARRWTGEDFVRGVFGVLDGLEPYVRTWQPGSGP
jgi:glycosyltransferase involved in cell wall biosynthesis